VVTCDLFYSYKIIVLPNFERNESIYKCHEKDISQAEIGEIFDLSQSRISLIIIALKNGTAATGKETRGSKSKLSDSQKADLALLLEDSPHDYGYTVWNKWSIQSLIRDEFGVDYHENYIFQIMRDIKFSSQKPKKKDYRQDPVKVARYKEQTVPEIQQKVDAENRRLVFQDESAVRLLPCVKSTYAPVGQTPELICDPKNKEFVSISGGISPDGYAYFEVREQEGFKQAGLTRFMDNLWADAKAPLLMIWDGAPSHKSKTVKAYLANQNQEYPRIWLANTPPYSPELNPIEQAWAWVKQKLANQFFDNTRKLKIAVTKILDDLKNNKAIIKAFFRHKDLACYQFSI